MPITDSLSYPFKLESNFYATNKDTFSNKVEWADSEDLNETSLKGLSTQLHLLNSPRIQKLQALVESKKLELSSVEFNRYPNFSVGLDYITISANPSQVGIQNSGKDAIITKVSLSLPIAQKKKEQLFNRKHPNCKLATISYKHT